MSFSYLRPGPWFIVLAGLASAGFLVSPVHGQGLLNRKQKCAPPPDVCAPATDPTKPPQPGQAPPPEPFLPPEQSVASVGETFAGAPNMIGEFLRTGNSLSFFYQRSQQSTFLFGTGAINSVTNSKISDNNSPIPQDRVSFRYNYFENAMRVTGDSGVLAPAPDLGVDRFNNPRFRSLPATKNYNEKDYTFSVEKTYFDRLLSVEMRVPFARALSRDQDLSVAQVVGTSVNNPRGNFAGNFPGAIVTSPTPGDTLGHSGDELGNVSIILKGLLHQSSRFAVSGGTGITIPTARANQVRVVDFLGANSDNNVEIQRLREFTVENETWEVSPYFAFLALPTSRMFIQGFLQFDMPLNKSRILYTETPLINTAPTQIGFNGLSFRDSIREQSLMHVDLGVGYWLVNRPDATWLTGIAPTVELHYTSTLNDADIRSLPVAQKLDFNGNQVGPMEPNPQIGNPRNHLDILNVTLGTTFEIANRATVAAGVAFPLKGTNDRTFDYEFQLQLNYRFGPRDLFGRDRN